MMRLSKQIAWLMVVVSFVVSLAGCSIPVFNTESEETLLVTAAPTEEATPEMGVGDLSTPVVTPTAVSPIPTVEPTAISIATSKPTETPAPTVQPTATARPVVTLKPIVVPTSVLTPTKTPTQAPTLTPTPTPTQNPGTDKPVSQAEVYCRSVLNQRQQAVYDTVVTALSNPNNIQTVTSKGETKHQIKVIVNYNATTSLAEELEVILSAIVMDHPEFYYLSKQYAYSYSGMRLTELYWYTLDRNTAISLQSQVESGIRAYQQQVSPYQDQYEIAKQYYELLATNIYYNHGDPDHAYSIAGAFVSGRCVCEGFSEAYQLLLNAYGIRAFTVAGNAGGPHQWIAVEINGQWYYTDPTWADMKTYGDASTYPKTDCLRVNYTYLNLTEEQMNGNRTLDDISAYFTAGLSFTATQDNYFVREGGAFQNFQQNEVEAYLKQAIVDALANKRETVAIRMGNQQAYDALLTYIHQNLYRVYYYEVGGPTANLTYIPNETMYTVHISIQ